MSCDMSIVFQKRALHRLRSNASSSRFQYILFFLKVIHYLLSRLLTPSIFSSTLPSMVFQKAIPSQYWTNPVCIPSFYGTWDISVFLDSRKHFFFYTINPTGSLHLSPPYFNPSAVFLIYFPSVQISAPYRAMFQIQNFIIFHVKYKSDLLMNPLILSAVI